MLSHENRFRESAQIALYLQVLTSTKSRQPRLLWVLTSLGVAISVFLWGTQYKLSLYDPPQTASHQVPIAKLLSKKEQPNIPSDSAAIVRTVSSALATGILLLLFLGALSCKQPCLRVAPVADTLPGFPYLHIPNLFVRPPPSLG